MNNSNNILQLKIPVRLAEHVINMRETVNTYQTNRHIKNVMCFIVLKAVTPYGVLHNYKQQIGYLASVCQCSKQTMLKRIAYMQDQQLATIEGADIRLISWKQVATLYKINLKEFTTVFYDYTTDKNIFLRLFAAEIDANKERQAYMIKTKLHRNLALKNNVQAAMLKHGADSKRINEFAYMHNAMRQLYTFSFIAEPELHAMLLQVRPHCNRSVKGLANAWGFNSPQLASYYKAKMATSNIATIHKGERITSQCRARNAAGHVLWDKRKQQTVLSLADTIVINNKTAVA